MIARADTGVSDSSPRPVFPAPHVVLRFAGPNSTEQHELSTCRVERSASEISNTGADSLERIPTPAVPAPDLCRDLALEVLTAVHEQHPVVDWAVHQVRADHDLGDGCGQESAVAGAQSVGVRRLDRERRRRPRRDES